jgi:hypothetical protein
MTLLAFGVLDCYRIILTTSFVSCSNVPADPVFSIACVVDIQFESLL